MYFTYFPKFLGKLGADQKIVTDIFTRVVVGRAFSELAVLLMPYTVRDGERIEHVAYDLYGAAEYHWVLILINGITNPYEDWPISTQDLERKVAAQYTAPHGTHHYELLNGVIIDDAFLSDYASSEYIAVTNYEYEARKNDALRQIKVLQPRFLNQFVQNFTQEVAS